VSAVRPQAETEVPDGFPVQAETQDGLPAEPPTFATAIPNWRPGDTIPFGGSSLRVVGIRDGDSDQPPVLVVEAVAG
jgi:hypothetical protein